MRNIRWVQTFKLPSHRYVCGHCGTDMATQEGFYADAPARGETVNDAFFYVYVCHQCHMPSYVEMHTGTQVPAPLFGDSVEHTPTDIAALYDEARRCIQVDAFTSSVLGSRKLLMNIAVAKGAKEGLKFIQYVDYLADNNYVPPDGKEWVDHIRTKGNEATHEIALMAREDAVDLITFLEMLLKIIYEFPAKVKAKKNNS